MRESGARRNFIVFLSVASVIALIVAVEGVLRRPRRRLAREGRVCGEGWLGAAWECGLRGQNLLLFLCSCSGKVGSELIGSVGLGVKTMQCVCVPVLKRLALSYKGVWA